MEEGALRVDANVSLHRPDEPLGTRTEIKNIGSVRGVAGAIRFEIDRQRAVLERGGVVSQETRSWDSADRVTVPMRDKEVVQDYRFMPEPNLPPLRVNLNTKEDNPDVISVPLLRECLPELPDQTRKHLTERFHLRPETAIQLVNEPTLLKYFHQLTKDEKRNATKVANLLINDLLTVLNKAKVNVADCPVTIEQLSELTDMVLRKEINLDGCKQTLSELIDSPNGEKTTASIVKERGLSLVSDDEEITIICKGVLENNPKMVKQYKEGKVKVFKALLGIVNKNTKNKLDMAIVSKKLDELLKNC